MKVKHNSSVLNVLKTNKSNELSQLKNYKKPILTTYGGIAELVLANFGENITDGNKAGKPFANS